MNGDQMSFGFDFLGISQKTVTTETTEKSEHFDKPWPFPSKSAREVQMRALSKGYGKPGFAYIMRQRLGKTLTAFAEYTLLKEEGLVDWFIVICPNSIKKQWMDAIEEVNPFIPIYIYESQSRKNFDRFFKVAKKVGGVFIINYESTISFTKREDWFSLFDPLRTYIVADESTKIKEPSLKSTKACLELASVCAYRRILTGKPTANSNADLWSQLKFIGATERNFYQHKYSFCVMGGWQGKTVMKNINTEVLKAEMEPYVYIAEDKYIKGCEKIYEPMRKVELEGELKRMYEQMEDDLLLELGNGTEITAPIALVKYLRLQQISSGIAGDPDGNQHNLVEPHRNPRIKATLDIIENDIDHKVIIVCRFKKSIENLKQVLIDKGYNCLTLVGGMKPDEIEAVKAEFNKYYEDPEESTDILIAQIQVLSYGHTLCGDDRNPCDSMIFYENDFSLLNRAQCESRPEKMERQKPISYYDFYASQMDRYIINALIRKEDAAMSLMGYARKHGIFGG